MAVGSSPTAGAHISAVARALGPGYRDAAVGAFGDGYRLAVGVGAICLLVAAFIALLGFRPPPTASADGNPAEATGADSGARASETPSR